MIEFIQTDVGGMAYIQFPWETAMQARTLLVKMNFHNLASTMWLSMGFYSTRLQKWERDAA